MSLARWTEVKDDLGFERLIYSVSDEETSRTCGLGKLSIVDGELGTDLVKEFHELLSAF